ncbi:MAG: ATP-dependent DNA helicase DinG [Hydrogenophaga sp.]|nr:ATP-dependent DNA helicase DinG [Hydrogenophaga sp.]MBD3893059.1 ATP-dependent DNA helicase DinG [Hydrogenophaga sp.]
MNAADPRPCAATPVRAPAELAALALAAFDHLVAHAPGFRARTGQRDMAAQIAQTLSGATLGELAGTEAAAAPRRGIAVLQAGTGVGKSVAYAASVIALALAQQKRVLISTATVALQEQLIGKDLPALAALLSEPFSFALAKGRGRYVCRLKLDQLSDGDAASAELFDNDADADAAVGADAAVADGFGAERRAERARQYAQWALQLDAGAWDGDRDRLEVPPPPASWQPVAAERHSCSARHCPSYHGCSYYKARARLAQTQVIVVNHDLLLSTLGMYALPDPSDCYLVLDEAHHLGAVAQGRFTQAMDLMHSQWLDRLPRAIDEVCSALQHTPALNVAPLARELKTALAELARLALARVAARPEWSVLCRGAGTAATDAPAVPLLERFESGALPPEWLPPLELVHSRANALLKQLEALAGQIKAKARDNPGEAARCARLYSRLGAFAPRLQHTWATSELFLQQPQAQQPPLAKWLQAGTERGLVTLSAHACPLQPGSLLRQQLWSRVRAAVLTSASLVSCGNFEHFLSESGLDDDPDVVCRAVQSPFDHARQGRLVVVQTQADPKDVSAYTDEMLAALLQDLAAVPRGALVLFTSRAQLRSAQELLASEPHGELRARVLVQGQTARPQLLARHAARVAQGQASILFGLQSFGEGLDLPGALCEWLFITKLPFASPNDPVSQARADWLKSQGRDPFAELVIPATGVRLLQWSGRALRSEADQAVIVCYDRRLLLQAYGRRLLQGLPPYLLQRRVNGVLFPV